jgi:nitronate monooxygenase
MALTTRLTEKLAIAHPILLAPMGMFSGGQLAAAVSKAGGLGLIGGGYGASDWLEREFAAVGNERVGCGVITWSFARQPTLFETVLARRPAALMLSFGSPKLLAARAKSFGIPVICQVQSIRYAKEAIDAGADVVVAQGAEAGGHSGRRSTFSLVPEVADLLAIRSPETPLVAAGGIADGRGLAAAMMLGADGVLMGSRFLVTKESAASPRFSEAIVLANGDQTLKARTMDIVRGYDWPTDEFEPRVLANSFFEAWDGRDEELAASENLEQLRASFWKAYHAGDPSHSGVLVGEAAGLIRNIPSVGELVADIVATAENLLRRNGR